MSRGKCKYGHSLDGCELGHPGCLCADDMLEEMMEAPTPRQAEPTTPEEKAERYAAIGVQPKDAIGPAEPARIKQAYLAGHAEGTALLQAERQRAREEGAREALLDFADSLARQAQLAEHHSAKLFLAKLSANIKTAVRAPVSAHPGKGGGKDG